MRVGIIVLMLIAMISSCGTIQGLKQQLSECKGVYKRIVHTHECEILEGASRMVFSLTDKGEATGVSCTMVSPFDVVVKDVESLNSEVEVE